MTFPYHQIPYMIIIKIMQKSESTPILVWVTLLLDAYSLSTRITKHFEATTLGGQSLKAGGETTSVHITWSTKKSHLFK